MKRFRFRLESLENLRAHEFEVARRAWQLLEREREARVLAIERFRERLDRGRALLASQLEEGGDSNRLSLAAGAVASGVLRVEQTIADLVAWMPTLDEARDVMNEARTRLRSLERLREKQSARHREQSERIEQAELDDLAQRKTARQSNTIGRLAP